MKRNDYLCHHGVKGQQWGVMHGPPYPIDRDNPVRIKSGSKIHSVSTYKKINLDKRGIYGFDPNDDVDSKIYWGAFSKYLRKYRGKKVYEHKYETTEDLLLPSHKEKVNAFKELYSDKDFKKELDWFTENYYLHERASNIIGERYLKSAKLDQKYSQFMMLFNENPNMKKYSDEFVNKLKDKGYNAIIDDNNAITYNGARNPLYVFNAERSLKETSKSNRLKDRDIESNATEVRKNNNGNLIL